MTRPSSALFKNRNFMALFIGRSFSSLGNNVYSFALLWDMKILTESPILMAFVGVGWALPRVLLGPLAGALVDRWDKRAVMIASDVLRFLLSLVVTWLSFLGALTPIEIIAATLLSNSISTAFGPANRSLMTLLIDKQQLLSANGLTQTMVHLAEVLGPGISAGLIAWQGVTTSYFLDALGYLVSIASLLAISVREPEREQLSFTVRRLFAEMKEGWQALRAVKVLMILIPAALVLNFLVAPIDLLLVQYATIVLHQNQVAVGELNASMAFGMVVGGAILGRVGKRVPSGWMIGLGLLTAQLCVIGLSIFPFLPVDVALDFFAGFGMVFANVVTFTMMQKSVDRKFIGRVSAFTNMAFAATLPFGMLLGGWLASFLPVRGLLAGIGICGSAMAVALLSNPAVRHAEQEPAPAASAVPAIATVPMLTEGASMQQPDGMQ